MLGKLQKRIEQKAEETFVAAVDKTANAVNTAATAGARVKALTDDPDESITVEAMVLIFVDAVRDGNRGERPRSRKEVIAAYRGRQRMVSGISRLGLWGAAAGSLSTLYSEAAVLCDVSDAAQLGLSREELGACILLLWGVMPEFDISLAALKREDGKSVVAHLKSRLPIVNDAHDPGRMTKSEAIAFLWKLRSLKRGKLDNGKSTVEEMIDRAEEQLRRSVTLNVEVENPTPER